jgi:RHH-type proline utilization regulon transcriptional repressor/proline dehydrogenase/delta 1-pyrroline-5-carboxylate dehydrogenase
VLFEGGAEPLMVMARDVASGEGPIRPILAATPQELEDGQAYPLDMLVTERSTSINTTAAGGNASLMSL